MIVPIYDANGFLVSSIDLGGSDDGAQIDGRVTLTAEGKYYKGAGTVYDHHYIASMDDPELYETFHHTGIFYQGYHVRQKAFKGKTGIFQRTYQPMFDDHIGSCGSKEFSMIENAELFDYSAIEFIKSFNYAPGQYYFRVTYPLGRTRYVNGGTPQALTALLAFMLHTGWNFTWDKNAIDDVTHVGKVRDVADLYQGKELAYQFGTVYAALHSLSYHDDKYNEYTRYLGLKGSIVSNCITLLDRLDIDVTPIQQYDVPSKNYKHAVLNYLMKAKNCGDCCMAEEGERIRTHYIKQYKQILSAI